MKSGHDATRVRLLRVLLGISVALSAYPFLQIFIRSGGAADLGYQGARQLAFLSFGIVGYVVALRRPANPIGWMLMAIGLAVGLQSSLPAFNALLRPPITVTGWMYASHNVLAFLAPTLATLVILLFPNGRSPSRLVGLLLYPLGLIFLANGVFGLLTDRGPVGAPNPLFVGALGYPVILKYMIGVVMIVILGSPLWRWRRAVGPERSQMKWMALAALLALGLVLTTPALGQFPLVIAFSLFPAAAGIAILRDRLFDIDFVINRSVLYGVVAVLLFAAYELLAAGVDQLLSSAQRDQFGAIRPILAVAVLPAFRPVERRIRPVVDRLLPATERLVLLFTDIVGSTEVAGALGDARWRDLLGRYYAAVRRELQRFGGMEVDTTGDGFFATFRDPLGAARCALALAPATAALGLRTRAGLHIGDCDMRGEGPIGINVHLAARVMASAEGDTVLASEHFRDALVDSSAVFESVGQHRLKGIPGEIRLYRLVTA